MIDSQGYTVWTYATDDGAQTRQAWNPAPGAQVPDFITLEDGACAGLDPDTGEYEGPGYAVPEGMMTVVPWTPPSPTSDPGQSVSLGWPGMTQVTQGSDDGD